MKKSELKQLIKEVIKQKSLINEAEFVNPFSGVIPDHKLNQRELTRAIRLAISAEHEAVHLYEAIADSTDNKKSKEVLQSIANEEKVHIGELEKLLGMEAKDEKKFREDGEKEVK